MHRTLAISAVVCLLAGPVVPASAACPGQTQVERARCAQIRKDPATRPGADDAAERRLRELDRREREREARAAWRDGYRRGRYEAGPVIVVPPDGD